MTEAEKKTLVEHLEDLRRVIVRSLAVFAVMFLAALPTAPLLLEWLKYPLGRGLGPEGMALRTIQVTGAFSATMRVAAAAALVASAPVILWFGWEFVLPALTPREKRIGRLVLGVGAGLFILGAGLGYGLILPAAVKVMWRWHQWLGVSPEWTLGSYLAFAVRLLLGFGLAFELPLLVLAAGVLGLVRSEQLRRWRRQVIVIVLVVAMLLTPPDVFTQIVMALPLILLYELCIAVLALWEHRRR